MQFPVLRSSRMGQEIKRCTECKERRSASYLPIITVDGNVRNEFTNFRRKHISHAHVRSHYTKSIHTYDLH